MAATCALRLSVVLLTLVPVVPRAQVRTDVRTTDSAWTFPQVATRADWEARAARIRQTILFRAGLWPLPPRTPLSPQLFGRPERNGFTVEKVYFESVPGFYVTGNLYRPASTTARDRPSAVRSVCRSSCRTIIRLAYH